MTGEITRQMILDAARISQKILDEGLEGALTIPQAEEAGQNITKYGNEIKPLVNEFKNSHNSYSPNLIMKKILEAYVDKNRLLNVRTSGHKYWGNRIHSFEWACITPKTKQGKPLKDLSHLVLPQLYMLICYEGIRFGFCYGDKVTPQNEYVQAVIKNEKLQRCIFNVLMDNKNNICLDNNDDKPQYNPNDNTKIKINKLSDIPDKWKPILRFVGYFNNSKIPSDVNDRIMNTLDSLLPIYKEISDI
jgi:hypothetical protein